MDMSLSEQLAFCTVRIECEVEKGTTTGTGFFFNFSLGEVENSIPVIVTNTHVVEGSREGSFQLPLANEEGQPQLGKYTTVTVENFSKRWIEHPNPSVDLSAMPMVPVMSKLSDKSEQIAPVFLDPSAIPSSEQMENLTTVEEVVMIGYPNGIWDPSNNQPIVRQGITATHPNVDYRGKKEFMIDAACFPGSSGSPVLIFNRGSYPKKSGALAIGSRLLFLGVLYAGPTHTTTGEIKIEQIPVKKKPVPVSEIPNNLGNVIKSSQLLEFKGILESMI